MFQRSQSGVGRKTGREWVAGFTVLAIALPLFGQAPKPQLVNGAVSAAVQSEAPLETPPAVGGEPHDIKFIIGNEDLLAINVWKEPDLSRSIPVRSDGKISLPLVGELQAAGRTPLQLEQEISTKLKEFITEPEVTVIVEQINSRKFNILGQVVKPGTYPLTGATTVLDAIAVAGGFRDFAKQKGVYILRLSASGEETRIAFNYKEVIRGKSPQQNIKIQPHDTIVVP